MPASRTRKPVPDPATTPTVTVDEIYESGWLSLSRGGLFNAVKSGEIPSIRLGRRILVPTAALRQMLGLDAAPQDAA